MAKYRKKPVVIEAMQWNGPPDDAALERFAGHWASIGAEVHITTLEGSMRVTPGDWIIKGVKGEFYPCKPDIFSATYEPADVDEQPRWGPQGEPENDAAMREVESRAQLAP